MHPANRNGILKMTKLEKIETLKLSDNSKNALKQLLNPMVSVLDSALFDGLYKTVSNIIKRDNSLLAFLLKLLDEPEDRYIKLPHYVNLNPRKLKSTEFLLKENGKYGILLNIISNRKTFNFSVRLRDMTIIVFNQTIQKQTRGSYRSFTLTDRFGNIAENWKTLKVFTIDEKKRIFDNHEKAEIILQEHFLSDQIATLFKDIKYFLLKCYIERLEMEREYWEKELDNLTKEGVQS